MTGSNESKAHQTYLESIDPINGLPGMMTAFHKEVHEGHAFTASFYSTLIADSSDLTLVGTLGAKAAHIIFDAAGGGDAIFSLYEGSSSTGGTPVVPVNMNRNASSTSAITVIKTPSSHTAGSELFSFFLIGGQRNFAAGSGGGSREEFIMKANTKYSMVLKNVASASKPMGLTVIWYEE